MTEPPPDTAALPKSFICLQVSDPEILGRRYYSPYTDSISDSTVVLGLVMYQLMVKERQGNTYPIKKTEITSAYSPLYETRSPDHLAAWEAGECSL